MDASLPVGRAEDDHGAQVSDATIMVLVIALVVALGWFVFDDAISSFPSRI
jgi:hypothetical protein